MYTKDDLPPNVALLLAAYQVDRKHLTDRFITICNQYPLDGLSIYEELKSLSWSGKCNADIREPLQQLRVLMLINK